MKSSNGSRIEKVMINEFGAGMQNDIRSRVKGGARTLVNFDALSFTNRLVPYRSSESGQDTITRKIALFVYENNRLYGLGSPASVATMYYKTAYTDGTWSTTANNASDIAEAASPNAFLIYYAKTGLIYGASGTNTIFAYDPTGVAAWADTNLSTTTLSRAVVHSKDDILYVSYGGNKIATNNNGSWTSPALTLPSRYYITALAEYGNYLAIGVRSVDEFQSSARVFLWNRDSSVSTLDESIDWGLGNLSLLEEYNGVLVGASYLDNGILGQVHTDGPERFAIRTYNGSAAHTEFELLSESGFISGGISGTKFQKVNNRLFFLMRVQLDTVERSGLWSLSRNSSSSPFILSLDYLANNDTAITSLDGFYVLGNYAFIAYNGSGAISKTDDTAAYTATSIWESLINQNMPEADRTANKQLLSVSFSYVPQGTGLATLKYSVDGRGWTTILSATPTSFTPTVEMASLSTGTEFTSGREYQFRVETTGGVQPTEIKYQYEVLSSLL